MDTKRMFLIKNISDFPDEINIPYIDEIFKIDLKKFLSLSGSMQDIQQLFEIFLFNLNQINDFYTMYYSDKIINKMTGKSALFIEVNALIINLISAGRALIERIENFFEMEIELERAKDFKRDIISKKYDEVFSYRFLCYLRNFAQHGNLPVSQKTDGRFCFDLYQILKAKHIKPSASIKKSMDDIYNEIILIFNNEPYIAVTGTIDAYTLTVVEIYYSYLKEVEPDVFLYHNMSQKIISENPEMVYHGEGPLDNMVILDLDENVLELYPANLNLWNLFVDYRKRAKEKLKFYRTEHLEPKGL